VNKDTDNIITEYFVTRVLDITSYFSDRRLAIRIMWYWELCQRWNTTCLLLLALNMISAHIMWQLNRRYGMYLQCHRSLCWS